MYLYTYIYTRIYIYIYKVLKSSRPNQEGDNLEPWKVHTIQHIPYIQTVLLLNGIVLNWTVFDTETVLTLNWIVIYNWIVWNRNVFYN